ncbi:TPA: hypothetical protein ACXISN_003455 [Salmonella enterica subsp. enterica serovar Horsham]
MNRSDSPKKQPKPFGVNGQRGAILPTTPAGDNSASYEQGFPPITMILKSAGGLPPKGQDMNQILYELSALGRWSSTGALNTFDSEFASEISGYPSGAMLISDDGERIFINTTEGNLSDPNNNGAGWKDALSYLGLGEGAPAIGVPFFWPSAAMPNTVIDSWSSMVFLKFNGAKFSASDYPVLAKVFPSLVLPEARGDFIRIWDDGRGVDGGRTLLSAQDFAQQRITGNFMGGAMGSSGSIKAGALVNSYTNYGATSQDLQHFSIDSAIETKTASETRPRNIAFNFLVRAK